MSRYILSLKTQKDIEEIYYHSLKVFGKDKAIEYLEGLREIFELLARNPELGKNRKEIRPGLFSLPYRSHLVFYRKLPSQLRIVRVLHGRRDIPKKFKK